MGRGGDVRRSGCGAGRSGMSSAMTAAGEMAGGGTLAGRGAGRRRPR